MDGRITGAAYRRKAEEKKQKDDTLKKVRKLESFFSYEKTENKISEEPKIHVHNSNTGGTGNECKTTNQGSSTT